MTHTFLASAGQITWRLLEMHGLDARAVFRRHGLGAADIRDPNARLPSAKLDLVAGEAAARIADPAFALRAARCWHPSNLGVLGHAWLSSSTLRRGLERMVRYGRLVGEKMSTRLQDTPEGVKLTIDNGRTDPVVGPIVTDLSMSVLVDMCRMNFGASFRPRQVQLKRSAPHARHEYSAFYGCPVHFNAPEDSFTLSARDADEPLPTSNRQLAATLDRLITEQLAHLDRNNVATRCQASLLEQLSSGELSEEQMAQRLHMSRRTLQRKLAEAETTYQKLLEDTRRDLALRYLEDPRHSITDITFLLGFSQQSAFTRAFRRWTGMSPTDYRAAHASRPAGLRPLDRRQRDFRL
jgi:AraC-like DNA-binding protein